MGYLADRVSARVLVITGGVIGAVGFVIGSFAQTLEVVIVAFGLLSGIYVSSSEETRHHIQDFCERRWGGCSTLRVKVQSDFWDAVDFSLNPFASVLLMNRGARFLFDGPLIITSYLLSWQMQRPL